MNITPNSDLKVLHNVPLDSTYEHTIYFGPQGQSASLTAQSTYFSTKTKYTFSDLTYQRVFDNKIRIEKSADDLYDCNYLMFRNTNFGTKWFYAFINKVTYINNAVSEIEYELDVMQTWYNEYTLDDCFVERMHEPTDNIDDNLVPEPFVPTNFVTYSELAYPITSPTGGAGTYTREAIIVTSDINGLSLPSGVSMNHAQVVNGIPCDVYYYICDVDLDYTTFQSIIQAYINAGKEQAIIGIFSVPPFIPNGNLNVVVQSIGFNVSRFIVGDFGGYTPKNRKLYSYPYNKLEVANSFGQRKEYRFDKFTLDSNNDIIFDVKGTALPKPSMVIMPQNYANSVITTDDILSVGEYPEGAFNGDSFMLWLHQGAIDSLASFATGVFRTVATDYVGSMICAGQTFSAVANMIAGGFKADLAPDNEYGNLKDSSAIFGLPTGYAFKLSTKRCDYTQARMADDFFTKFGYAQNRIMKPNLHARTHWTYVKTQACTITGTVPADDQRKIEGIYNTGTTFWANGDEIGNYSLSNDIII